LPHATNCFSLATCNERKVREGDKRFVKIHEGNPKGLDILIVDDMVKSGGTICEAAKVMKAAGAKTVTAFCAHAAGRPDDLAQFLKGGSCARVLLCPFSLLLSFTYIHLQLALASGRLLTSSKKVRVLCPFSVLYFFYPSLAS